MAKIREQVTEAEYKADPDGVEAKEISFPDGTSLTMYSRSAYVDDITEKPAEGTQTINLLVPVDVQREVVALDAEGDPIQNDDGTDKLETVTELDYKAMEIDLSPANLKKLRAALKPYVDKARDRVVSVPRAAKKTAASGPNPELTSWNRRVKAWLEENRPELDIKHNTRGPVKAQYEEIYMKNNPNDQKPV